MQILVAGATGALGSQLVPRLVANGHDVAGTTRSRARFGAIRALGATPVERLDGAVLQVGKRAAHSTAMPSHARCATPRRTSSSTR
jgi:nucleoside-diphosphate-sugar epimerase